jgi:hypothetical protein
MVVIREAQIEEAEGISACLNSAFEPFRSQYTAEAFEDTVPSPGAIRERMVHMRVYVAITGGGGIVGTLACGMQGKAGYLRGMAIIIALCGKGAELLNSCLVQPRTTYLPPDASGLPSIQRPHWNERFASIARMDSSPLERAIRFYRKNGFVPTGVVIDFFGMPLYEYGKPLMNDAALQV